MPPPPLPSPSRDIVARRGSQRLSLQFQLPNNEGRRSRPASIISASPISARPSSPDVAFTVEADPNAFLVTLAGQERRVLELKEELQKAEVELSKLKSQWSMHEAAKKRHEIHRIEPLRDMSSPVKGSFEPGALPRSRTSAEDERKKAMYVRTKPSQRKVFAGGRHTRALSLLSPTSLSDGATSSNCLNPSSPARHSIPLSAGAARTTHVRTQTQGSNRDIVYSGKEIVGGLREGLWTFIEDLKQATIGDEAITGARAKQTMAVPNRSQALIGRRSPSGRSPSTASKMRDHVAIDGSIEQVPALEKAQSQPLQLEQELVDPMVDVDDGWDNWDSPPPKTSTSVSFSTTAGSSPRTSVR